MTEFTSEQLAIVRAFLAQVQERAIWTPDEWVAAMQFWGRGSPIWSEVYGFSVIGTHTALWWYQYRHKPGSREWRPGIILRALIKASERDYAEPERIPVSTVALMSSSHDRKKARKAFIKKYDVATYYRQIVPILASRRPQAGGMQGLFTAPATPERREYVRMLVEIASGREKNNGGANGRHADRVDE